VTSRKTSQQPQTAPFTSAASARAAFYRVVPGSKEAQTVESSPALSERTPHSASWDPKSNTLWVCSNDLSAWVVAISGSDGVSALKGFDLKTGEGKLSAALPGTPALCNDITIGPDGRRM